MYVCIRRAQKEIRDKHTSKLGCPLVNFSLVSNKAANCTSVQGRSVSVCMCGSVCVCKRSNNGKEETLCFNANLHLIPSPLTPVITAALTADTDGASNRSQ